MSASSDYRSTSSPPRPCSAGCSRRTEAARLPARVWLLAAALLVGGGSIGPAPAGARQVRLADPDATLADILARLGEQSGYQFLLRGRPGLGNRRAPIHLDGVPLIEAMREIGERYHCRFGAGVGLELVVEDSPPARPPAGRAGPFQLSWQLLPGVAGPVLEISFRGDPPTLAAVSGVAPEMLVIDARGRDARADPSQPPTALESQVFNGEGTLRVALSDPLGSSPRLRIVRGALLIRADAGPRRIVLPVRGPFPVDTSDGPVAATLLGFRGLGDAWTADVRVSWPSGASVVAQGPGAPFSPALVDEAGRAYRHVAGEHTFVPAPGGRRAAEQSWRFEGLRARPAAVVYELYAAAGAPAVLPFELRDLPLPAGPRDPAFAELDDPAGGGIRLRLLRDGLPARGAVPVAFSRRQAAEWRPWRWIEGALDDEGVLQVEGLRPGRYRLLVGPAKAAGSGRAAPIGPIEFRVEAGRFEALSPVTLPAAAPARR